MTNTDLESTGGWVVAPDSDSITASRSHDEPLISVDLARRLRDAGLRWRPADGDRFMIPDRNLDDRVFSISEMTIDTRPVPGGRLIAFNGTVEWALDSIMQHEVLWLPGEAQLRALLGDAFRSLTRTDGEYRCEIDAAGERLAFTHAHAAEAYGLALLERLRGNGGNGDPER